METEIKAGDLVEYYNGSFLYNPRMLGVQAMVLEVNNSIATLDFRSTPNSPKYEAYIQNLRVIKPREKKWRM